jgi:hypothetical protein
VTSDGDVDFLADASVDGEELKATSHAEKTTETRRLSGLHQPFIVMAGGSRARCLM